MKNLKHIIYLFTIFFLIISCENNTKKPDIKKANISEVNRPTPNNTELEKKIIPIDNGENLLFQRLMFNEQTALFASSLTSGNLINVFLNSENKFTVFAPSNDAFKAVDGKILSDLFKDKFLIAAVLKLHIVPEKFDYETLSNKIVAGGGTFSLKTLMGEKIKATLSGNQIVLTDFNGTQVNVLNNKSITTDDGVYYIIDKVMAIN
ncbi:fasciclin domain-containing protein [Flavobacteriaceae bacterium]|nr:fasciclin domain-containing protein [Flavobacteriaceae bacterium]MDC0857799.1 fasciclin domain-containing protein [Flavobacteriaceae bacterium]